MTIIKMANKGVTSLLHSTVNALSVDLWAAIDKATTSGIPSSMLIGMLRMVEAKVMDDLLEQVE